MTHDLNYNFWIDGKLIYHQVDELRNHIGDGGGFYIIKDFLKSKNITWIVMVYGRNVWGWSPAVDVFVYTKADSKKEIDGWANNQVNWHYPKVKGKSNGVIKRNNTLYDKLPDV